MLTVVRLDRPADVADLVDRAGAALRAFAACRGFVRGWFGPATDDPALCVFAMEWETVGAYRRALSTYDVKMNAVPLLYLARDEPTAYETVLSATPTAFGTPRAISRRTTLGTALTPATSESRSASPDVHSRRRCGPYHLKSA